MSQRYLGVPDRLLLMLVVACGLPLAQAQQCYQVQAKEGDGVELRFSGAVEGTPFRGRFDVFDVRACLVDGTLEGGEITANIAMGSASVGNRDGNQALRGSDFFFVDQFPMAEWRSDNFEGWAGEGSVVGVLTIKSTSAEQAVQLQTQVSQSQMQLIGSAEINRLTWSVGVGEFEDPSFIRDRVDLSFDLTLALEAE